MNDKRPSIVMHSAWLDAEFAELPDVVGITGGPDVQFR